MANRAEGIAEIRIDDQQAENALKQLSDRAKELNKRLHETRKANDKAGHDKAKRELNAVNREMKKYQRTTVDVKNVLDNLSGASYKQMLKAQRSLRASVRNMNRGTKEEVALYKKKVEQLNRVDAELKKVQRDMKYAGTETNRFGQIAKKVGPWLAATFSIGAITGFVSNVVRVRKEFETYAAVLTNTLGSKSDAQKALRMIQDFAAKTPFQISELTGSFVKLANQGFKPTRDEMRKLGDLAASTGKGFDQLAEAIIDAQVGEFERLKEFGIRAQKQGDQVTFTFKGVKEQVDFTEESIQKYLLSLGDVQGVSGSMSAISETLEGKISNLGDAWDSLLNTLGKLSGGVIMNVIGGMQRLVTGIESFFSTSETEEQRLRAVNTELVNRIEVLKKAEFTDDQRRKYIREINEKYGEYLPNLISEKDTVSDLTTLQKQLNETMMEKIMYMSYQEEISKLMKIQLAATKLQYEAEKEIQENRMDQTFTGLYAQKQEEQLQGLKKFGKTLVEDQQGNIDALEKKYEQMAESIGLVFSEVKAKMSDSNDSKIEEEVEEIESNILEEKIKSLNEYYAAINDLEDQQYRNSLTKGEQELLAIDQKYEELYKKADDAGQETEELQLQHAQELAEKLKEIEKRTQSEILQFKKQHNLLSFQELMQQEIKLFTLRAEQLKLSEEELQQGIQDIKDRYADKAYQKEQAEINKQLRLKEEEKYKKIALVTQFANTAMDILGLLSDFTRAAMNKELEAAGDNEEKKEQIREKYAKKQQKLAVIDAIISGAAGIVKTGMNLGFPAAIPFQILQAAQTAAQIALIKSQQFARGKYDVVGAGDGRTYQAGYAPQAATGIYPEPTLVGGLGLVGERAPEMVIDGNTLKRMQINTPEIIDAIMAQRVPQHAAGSYPAQQPADNTAQLAMLDKIDKMITALTQSPIRAKILYSDIEDSQNEIDEIKRNVSK